MVASPKKVFVLDTNVLLHDSQAIFRFQEHDIVIPIVVIEEMDSFKKDQTEVGRNARAVSRQLDRLRAKGSLSDGV
ncbi:MAG: PIN domain-containing protein, partial [Firmicutes bacterium]|nr:PIN domain-containing protein [Bacillota bacterium]